MKMNAHQLISDALAWADMVGDGAPVPPKYAEMSKAMLQLAGYIRTGVISK